MSTSYKVLFFLHIVSIVVAFAPASVNPLLTRQFAGESPALLQRFAGFAAQNSRRVYAPALGLAGLWGILIVLVENDLFSFGDTWVSLSFAVWIAMNGIIHGMMLPNERRLGEGDASAERKIDTAGMLVTVLFLVMLYLMIWKPGA